jgi:hypothetical protein
MTVGLVIYDMYILIHTYTLFKDSNLILYR